jgi:ribosome-binding protein aMBF1 (putative translation factor)
MKRKLSEQLRKAIDASGMSRYEICKRIGDLSESSMSHFMAGRAGLSQANTDKIGELLDLRIVTDNKGRKGKGAVKHG